MAFLKVHQKSKVCNFNNIILNIAKSNLNSLLLKNYNSINKLPFQEKIKILKPLFETNINRTPYSSFTPEQKYQIDITNKYFFNKLKNQNTFFNSREWERDFKQNQIYKKNICSYPCIDFHKSVQRKIEDEKAKIKKIYYNTTVNFYTNLFNKTKFKEFKLFQPNNKKDEKKIDNEHFLNGETKREIENKEFDLYFLIINENINKKIKVVNCKKDDFFFDVVDKLCKMETSIDKDKILINEFSIKGKPNDKEYIDYNDTLDGNNLQGNEEIIIKFKI